MYYDTIVIGGGASGLCTAIKSKNKKNSVLILEHKDRVGKKLLATGNGKCNLTNIYAKTSCFHSNPEGIYPYFTSGNKEFIENVINLYDCDNAIKWFENIGLICKNKNGYVYPLSEQASAVLDALRYQLVLSDIKLITDYKPKKICKKNDIFIIDDKFSCKNLVLSCGGLSAEKTGSDGSGYKYAEGFGHSICKPKPALCGLKCDSKAFTLLAGVRSDCRLTLFYDTPKSPLMEISGCVQFNSTGISGIPSMQLSCMASYLFDKCNDLYAGIDFLPAYSFDKTVEFIYKKICSYYKSGNKNIPSEWLFSGFLNKKTAHVVLKELGLNKDDNIDASLVKFKNTIQFKRGKHCGKNLSDIDDWKIFAARSAGIIKHFKARITGICGFNESQATLGGISTEEINPLTMESLLVPGLFFTGEIVDVCGICGGYNLQWAWATADRAANSINNRS